MKYEFGKSATNKQDFTSQEQHVFEWSTVILNSLKANIDYYSKSGAEEFNKFNQNLHQASDDRLIYSKKTPSLSNLLVDIMLSDDSETEANLASYDYDRHLPLKYIDQKVVCKAQMLVTNWEQSRKIATYEFFKHVDRESAYYGATTILSRSYEERMYLDDCDLDDKTTEPREIKIKPRFIQIDKARIANSNDTNYLSKILPESFSRTDS